VVARGGGRCTRRLLDGHDASAESLDGAGDFVLAVGRQDLGAEHAQLEQVAPLLLQERELLAFLDEVRAGQAGQPVPARQERAQAAPADAEVDPSTRATRWRRPGAPRARGPPARGP
jgi:hypothetical protein